MSLYVRADQVRALLRLIAEARSLPPHPGARLQHAVDGMGRLLGSRLAAIVEVTDFRSGGTGRLRRVISATGVEEGDFPLVVEPLLTQGSYLEPALARTLEIGGPGGTWLRNELTDDGTWYHNDYVMDRRRARRLDDSIISLRPFGGPLYREGLCFNRAWGDRPFTEEERNLVVLFHDECRWLYCPDDTLARFGIDAPPRERRTLDLLLRGASEKEAAAELGLSPHTVHQYVKSLYRKLGVRSRGELMARFVG